jgi:hypothetical protein
MAKQTDTVRIASMLLELLENHSHVCMVQEVSMLDASEGDYVEDEIDSIECTAESKTIILGTKSDRTFTITIEEG